jgi:MYXO-CTERM domain-containing protein
MQTGLVTTFRAGSEITVRWQETVGHPGHFRISLAADRSDLVDPVVETSNGDGVSGVSIDAAVMDPVAYPVLADDLVRRDLVIGPQEEPFTAKVRLPNTTCDKCTLQVIQFMASHVPNFFYHHCADVRIVAADADIPDEGTVSGGPPGEADAGSNVPSATGSSDSGDSSGGCSISGKSSASGTYAAALLALAVGAAAFRRRAPWTA